MQNEKCKTNVNDEFTKIEKQVRQHLETERAFGIDSLASSTPPPAQAQSQSAKETPVSKAPAAQMSAEETPAEKTPPSPAPVPAPVPSPAPSEPPSARKAPVKSAPTSVSIQSDIFSQPTPAGGASTTEPETTETPEQKRSALDELAAELADCDRCPLAQTRTKLVFGAGSPSARLMFVGEAPGRDEDAQGIPFIGRAGKLLDRIIIAMGLTRDEVYIGNILKCRPPENRNPNASEVVQCLPFLKRQIGIIRPDLIVCLGGVAAQTLLETKQGIGKLRGRFLDYAGTKLLCTYHPAYLLRNPHAKGDVWEDMQKALKFLGMPIPKR